MYTFSGHDSVLLQAQDMSSGYEISEYPDNSFSAIRGMVIGALASLIIWAIIIFLLKDETGTKKTGVFVIG